MFRPLPHRGRGDGWHGYDGGHSERSVNDEAFHHFRSVAVHLKEEAEKGKWEKLIVGCLDTNWRDFETQLHPDIKKCFLGRFSAVPEMSLEEVREASKGVFRVNKEEHRQDLVHRVLSHAKSHTRGVTGLRRVLRSLELGEVRSLLVADNYLARGVECTSCGRLDAHLVRYCALCGHSTRKLEDIFDAMVPMIVRKDTELVCVRNQELEDVGNIAALLRFRSASGNHQMAEAS
jgi:peptide chain release factor subunit 1